MADLIDRQEAIEALGKRPGLAGECEWEIAARKQYDDDRAAIESVPSAQHEITLESAIDYLHSIGWLQEHDRVLTESARPEQKTGRWMLVKGSNGKDYHKCSECLHTQEITGVKNYCAVCGARMEDGDE